MKLTYPSGDDAILLRKQRNEDFSRKEADLQAVRDWLRKEPHLPDTMDDAALLNFLRSCKFSLERTKKKIDTYFTIRVLVPEFFADRDITRPEMQRVPEHAYLAVLPGLTPNGRRITVAANHGPFTMSDCNNFIKMLLMIGDIRVHMEHDIEDIYVLDASVLQWKNLPNASVSMIKKFFICIQQAYPVIIKEVHIINATPLITVVLKWVSRFLKDKIISRIRVHESLESLHEFVPKDLLPEEYGGTAGKVMDFMKTWMLTLEEYNEWFKEQEMLRKEEAKTAVTEVSSESLFGVEGSFRQLSID